MSEVRFYMNDNGDWVSQDDKMGTDKQFDEFMYSSHYYLELFKYIARTHTSEQKKDVVELCGDITPGELYDHILLATCMNIWGPESFKKAEKLLNWLHTTNFYESPASTVFHESYVGGLLDHHLNVAAAIIRLHASNVFNTKVDIDCAIFAALVHDFCKIGAYEQYMKWQKDDNNQWIQVHAFKRASDPSLALGHGESSMYIVQKFFPLKMEMAAAIRWHMGKWRVPDDDVNNLQYCNEHYPLVHLLQFADQISITQYDLGWPSERRENLI